LNAARPLELRQLDERRQQVRASLIRARALFGQRLADYSQRGSIDSILGAYEPGTHVNLDIAFADVLAVQSELRSLETQAEVIAINERNAQKLQATLIGLERQLEVSETHLARLVARAPASGVVLTENMEQMLGAAVREGELLMEIGDPTAWQAVFYVGERDIDEIHVGDRVTTELPVVDRDRPLLAGEVTFVAGQPSTLSPPQAAPQLSSPALYRVTASVTFGQGVQSPITLKRGYTVRGHVITRSGRLLNLLWQQLRHGSSRS
jgi:multidrug resistance efflux pump